MHRRWKHILGGESTWKASPFAITIAVVAALAVLLLTTRRAPPAVARAEAVRSLPLTLAGEGERLSLVWNRAAPAIQAGECGVLWVADGGIHRRVVLDASQLRAGKLFYWPVNKDVSFELKMSGGDKRSGEPVCGNNADSLPQLAEGPARRAKPVERKASRSRRNTGHRSRRQRVESHQSEDARGDENARIEAGNASAFTLEGEPQRVASLPVHAVERPTSENQLLSVATRQTLPGTPEPSPIVTVEAVTESRLSHIVDKIPLLRRRHRTPDFLPPRPVRQTTPTVPAELRGTLKGEVPLDVRAYIDESGKVTYAELLSHVTEADRGLASVAVFDARHWLFLPAEQGGSVVPGQVILHYRFGNLGTAINTTPAE